jgi:outer membrane protein
MIRKTAWVGCCAAALLWPAAASAETLQEALEAAYANNPTLAGQRANVRVADENVPLARAAGLPTVEEDISYQENILKGQRQPGGFTSNPDRHLTAGFSFNAPLTTFGAVGNSIKAAKARVEAGRLGLRLTESELFTAVVGAYMDVLRDEAVVQLNQRNAEVMRFTVRETTERQNAGNRGPTDVAQSEARLSLAESQLETAQSRLVASREQYIRLVGHPPGELMPPPPLPQLPASGEEAVQVAKQNNPELLSAHANAAAAAADVEAADANRYPKFNAIGGINTYNYLGSLDPGTGPRNGDQGTTAFLGVQLKVPIVDGGRSAAELRQAQARHSVAVEQVADAERKMVADTRSAYANWRAASRVVSSAQRGVDANQRVLAGMRAETSAGFRPLLDRLNAEQELLNAQVTMVTARRDAYVAGFALLAAMGRAEARDLQFDSSRLYDPVVNYERVHDRVLDFGREPEPAPVGTTTIDTPAQDAAVKPADVPPVPAAQ